MVLQHEVLARRIEYLSENPLAQNPGNYHVDVQGGYLTTQIPSFATGINMRRGTDDFFRIISDRVNVFGKKLSGVSDPVSVQDAATKNYVDSLKTVANCQSNVENFDIQNTSPIELPLTGNQIIVDDSYAIVGNAIRCLFAGRIRVTTTVSMRSEGTDQRSTGRIQIAKNGVLGSAISDWYNRRINTSGQEAQHCGATLVDIIQVEDEDLISVYNTALEGDNREDNLQVGSNFLIERIG